MDLKFILMVFVAALSLVLVLWFWALPATSDGTINPVIALAGTSVIVAIAIGVFRGVWSVVSGKLAGRKR